jgi:UDP-4-amino-4,6-dideoxy-N-acetyl-beta-L-altrosamine N-acetyltransferase
MIGLRPLSESDGARLHHWRGEPEVDRWMSDLPAATEEAHALWLRAFLVDPDGRGWIITDNDQPAGFLMLTGLTGRHRRAAWGWYIGEPAARGRGAGRAAQALGLDIAFGELGLEKVWSEVLADNDTALRAQDAAGFRREGYMRRHILKDGQFRDVVLLAILADEWGVRGPGVRASLVQSRLIAP